MPGRCIFIDDVEFEPLEGGNLHFTIATGDERMRFCMSRSTVIQAAHNAMSAVNDATDRERFQLIQFG